MDIWKKVPVTCRPINFSEFKIILNKKWDLHAQFTKSAQPPWTRSHYDTALAPAEKTAVIDKDVFKSRL
jgi:hypothetical protein